MTRNRSWLVTGMHYPPGIKHDSGEIHGSWHLNADHHSRIRINEGIFQQTMFDY